MSSFFDEEDSMDPHRFLILNLVPETQRSLFDISNIPVGDIFPSQFGTSESTLDSQELLHRKNLFPDLSTFCPHIPDTNTGITDSHVVTVTTAPTAATTLLPLPPMGPPAAGAPAAAPEQHDPPPANTTKKAPSRKRFSYQKKYFYADSSMYLELNNDYPHPGGGESSLLPELVGYLLEVCPQKRNGEMYHI